MGNEAVTENITPISPADNFAENPQLKYFWEISQEQRLEYLQETVLESHNWHFQHNQSYRQTVSARGIGEQVTADQIQLLLRPTAQTFKSYIDILGTPFPQDKPVEFMRWMINQLSIQLPEEPLLQLKSRYNTLESLLSDIEQLYREFGLEVITSSGTSGRSTIMVRDQEGINKTVESFYLSFQRYFEMQADHRAIFIMPQSTRIAMARMASFSVSGIGLPEDRIHYTIPYSAHPDLVRIRAGRTYRSGFQGWIEHRVQNPFMNWANEKLVTPRAIRETFDLLIAAEKAKEKVLLFGGWVQLHAVARYVFEHHQTIQLTPGSLVGTGGGMKEMYPFSPSQIREEISRVIRIMGDEPIPIRDVYGMAEANWAAMQCRAGNYHIPPWIYPVVLDGNGKILDAPVSNGILAFFDPIGGGKLFPSFFKTADSVKLVNGGNILSGKRDCACGEQGAYILKESIQRVDLLDEAGCAAQV